MNNRYQIQRPRLLRVALGILLLTLTVLAQAGEPAAAAAPDHPLFIVVLQPATPGEARTILTNELQAMAAEGLVQIQRAR